VVVVVSQWRGGVGGFFLVPLALRSIPFTARVYSAATQLHTGGHF
jgi:hypothetical protein